MSAEEDEVVFENENENENGNGNGNGNTSENENGNENANGNENGASRENSAEEGEGEEDQEGLFLGDHITIPWRGGVTSGTLYYMDESLFRIRPDGAPTTLVDFPLSDGTFDEDLGVSTDELEFSKGARLPFVEQEGYRVGQVLDAYKDGRRIGQYTVTDVNAKDNKLRMEGEDGVARDLSFGVRGIDLSEPFDILMIPPLSVEDKTLSPEEAAEEAATDAAVRTVQETQGADAAIIFGEDFFTQNFGEVELPQFVQVKKKLSKDQVFSEPEQKDDMLNELFNMFDFAQQQNPLTTKRIRTLVEMMSALKLSILDFDSQGNLVGQKKISLRTFQDLLNQSIPIARPVLNSKRVLVTESKDEVEDTSVPGVHIMHLNTFREESDEFIQRIGDIPATEDMVGPPRWYQMLGMYFNRYPMGDEYGGKGYQLKEDSEFFRAQPPGFKPLPGFANGTEEKTGEKRPDAYNGAHPADYVVNIEQSLRRGHGPTVYALPKGGTEIYKSGDKADLLGHVLFPYKAVAKGVLGAIRTGQLWSVILRSSEAKLSIEQIIQELGTIQSLKDEAEAIVEPDVQRPIYVTPQDTALLEISFAEYLKTVLESIVPRGPGDLFAMKYDLGILEAEPDEAQMAMIQERVKVVIANLVQTIQLLNEKVLEGQDRPTIQPVVEGAAQLMLDAIAPFSYLTDVIKQMDTRTPGYKGVDIAILASLTVYSQDFALAVLGQNREAKIREQIKAGTQYMLDQLKYARLYMQQQRERGLPPEPVMCPQNHPQQLDEIRRKKDPNLRMKALAIFASRYKGGIDGNWVNCQYCDNHLICKHEMLQIQQFLNPAQNLVLQKEIVLNFAGGTFGTNYICKQCGQPIGELGFDTSMEYDDEGRPMMGRDVLTDKEQIQVQELEDLFNIQIEKQEELKFADPNQTAAYRILKVFTDRIGITMDSPRMLSVIQAAASEFQLQLNEKRYIAEGSDKKMRFSVYKAYNQITIVIALVLLDIQTRTPDYPVQFFISGCKPGFGGWPLLEDAKLESADETIGLLYMECALKGIDTNTYPWNEIRTHSSAEKRQKYIHDLLIRHIQTQLQRAEVQANLEKKRRYIKATFGEGAATGKYIELIPDEFLPRIETYTEAAENAASQPTVAEGAHGAYGQLVTADTWIRTANKAARSYIMEHGLLIQGSPFAELGCCYGDVHRPGEFFKSIPLPPEPKFRPIPPGFYKQTVMVVPLTPRPLQTIDVKPDVALAYRVYLKLCFRGERAGQPHEIGYDYTCDWCGLQLPKEVLIHDRDKDGNPVYGMKVEALVNELTRQGVEFTEEAFQALLDRERLLLTFQKYAKPAPKEPQQILASVANITHQPSLTWKESVERVIDALKALKADPSEVEIRAPLGILRSSIQPAVGAMSAVLNSKLIEGRPETVRNLVATILKEAKENPYTFFNIMRAYFLVPAQRLVSRFSQDNLYVPSHFKLEQTHIHNLEEILQNHTEYLIEYGSFDAVSRRKLNYFVKMLKDFLDIGNELKISRLRLPEFNMEITQNLLNELLSDILIGCIGFLVNDDVTTTPTGNEDEEDDDEEEEEEEEEEEPLTHENLKFFVSDLFRKFARERLPYNMTRVREEIARAKELEKNYFISIFDTLSPDERRVEKFFEKHKIKSSRHNWTLGSSKLNYDDVYLANQEMLGRMYSMAVEGGGLPEDSMGADMLLDGLMAGDDAYAGDGFLEVGERGCGDGDD